MGKKEIYERELVPLIQRYLENGDETRLLEYLTGRSNLPGPRANLELLGAFGDLFSKRCREKPVSYWELAMKLAGTSRSFEGRDEPAKRICERCVSVTGITLGRPVEPRVMTHLATGSGRREEDLPSLTSRI